MKNIEELDLNEKTRTDTILFNTLKDYVERIERSEQPKNDKIHYKLPPASLCNYSVI